MPNQSSMSKIERAPLARALLLACAWAVLPACVTEEIPRGGRDQRRSAESPGPDGLANVIRPADDARTLNTAVSVAIKPLGSVPYDGQVLPLVSPDGRFVATQTGESPTWPTLTASPDATVPLGARIEVYDIAQAPPRRVTPSTPLPAGLVLGRSSDATGFLVEAPRPDGARWIGRIRWASGALEWLVKADTVASNGLVNPSVGLLFLERAGDRSWRLASRDPEGVRPLETPGIDPVALLASEPRILYLLARSRPGAGAGLDLVALELGGDRVGEVLARKRIARGAHGPLLAYQIASTAAMGRSGVIALYVPALGSLAAFDRGSGEFLPLAGGSIAASRSVFTAEPGWFCATSEGLVYVADAVLNELEAPPHARVLADPYVPRAIGDAQRPVVLLGPDPRNDRRISITLMGPAE